MPAVCVVFVPVVALPLAGVVPAGLVGRAFPVVGSTDDAVPVVVCDLAGSAVGLLTVALVPLVVVTLPVTGSTEAVVLEVVVVTGLPVTGSTVVLAVVLAVVLFAVEGTTLPVTGSTVVPDVVVEELVEETGLPVTGSTAEAVPFVVCDFAGSAAGQMQEYLFC